MNRDRLRDHIERRERGWHQRDQNRFQRPFEWGLEHVGLDPLADPLAALLGFAADAVSHSDEFYSCPPTEAFTLDDQVLRFPSAVTTPEPLNNTVWGRYFPGGGRSAVILLPQWNAQPDSHMGLARLLQRMGVSALRLSLPYHDRRRPEQLERAEYMIGPNLGRTIASTRQAVLDVRRAADWLERAGYSRLGILGTSIGSCIGFLALAHDPRFEAAAFIHVSSHFADVVWEGLSTEHVRAALEPAIALGDLRRIWEPISPYPFIPRLKTHRPDMLVLSGKYDLSFPFDLTRVSFSEFERHLIPHQAVVLPCGHYTMAHFPFNAIAGFRIGKFFRRFK
jgi:hypothetical protein